MSNYEPGTVAVATVRGVTNVRVFRIRDHHDVVRWVTADNLNGWLGHHDSDVTDVRPLVVLDLELTDAAAAALVSDLRECNWRAVANQIETQTKPPRIPEPTGFAPVVEAGVNQHDERLRWYRNMAGSWTPSVRSEYARDWDDLVDPVLVRDGIEDAS
jgi:hypothetical protein